MGSLKMKKGNIISRRIFFVQATSHFYISLEIFSVRRNFERLKRDNSHLHQDPIVCVSSCKILERGEFQKGTEKFQLNAKSIVKFTNTVLIQQGELSSMRFINAEFKSNKIGGWAKAGYQLKCQAFFTNHDPY